MNNISKNKLQCPRCGNEKYLLTQKGAFGATICTACQYKGSTDDFVKIEQHTLNEQFVQTNKRYLTANGEIVKVLYKELAVNWFKCSNGVQVNEKGHDIRDNASNDLIAEIPNELQYEIIKLINKYYTTTRQKD